MKSLLVSLIFLVSASTAYADLNGSYVCSGLTSEAYPVDIEITVTDEGMTVLFDSQYEDEPDLSVFNYGGDETQGWVFGTEVEDGDIDEFAYKLVNLEDRVLRVYYESVYTFFEEAPEAAMSIIEFYQADSDDHFVLKVSYNDISVESSEYEGDLLKIDTDKNGYILKCDKK